MLRLLDLTTAMCAKAPYRKKPKVTTAPPQSDAKDAGVDKDSPLTTQFSFCGLGRELNSVS
jgi:hypothetical protein